MRGMLKFPDSPETHTESTYVGIAVLARDSEKKNGRKGADLGKGIFLYLIFFFRFAQVTLSCYRYSSYPSIHSPKANQ